MMIIARNRIHKNLSPVKFTFFELSFFGLAGQYICQFFKVQFLEVNFLMLQFSKKHASMNMVANQNPFSQFFLLNVHFLKYQFSQSPYSRNSFTQMSHFLAYLPIFWTLFSPNTIFRMLLVFYFPQTYSQNDQKSEN